VANLTFFLFGVMLVKIAFQDSGRDACPFCRKPVSSAEFSDHTRNCPALLAKRQLRCEEGELPPHLKEVLRRKGSFLTGDVEFVG
jgi:hypothetical protein